MSLDSRDREKVTDEKSHVVGARTRRGETSEAERLRGQTIDGLRVDIGYMCYMCFYWMCFNWICFIGYVTWRCKFGLSVNHFMLQLHQA